MRTGILLLNSTFEALRVVSLARGVNLVLAGRAEVIEESDDEYLRSEKMAMPVPLVIRLTRFVRVPYRARLPLTRKNLVARDKAKCQYCGKTGTTIDHVVPRSKGGLHEWENVVLACSPCNGKKGDRTLRDLKWELHVTPRAPHGLVWFVIGVQVEEAWQPYLQVA